MTSNTAPVDEVLLERFKRLSSGEIADTKLDTVTVLRPDIGALHTDCSVVGPVRTAMLDPSALCAPVGTLEDADEGEVVVIDADGCVDEAVWGDLLSAYATKRGVEGVVTNGAIRDVSGIRDLGFPAFARELTPRGPTGSGEEAERNVPVTVGGASIQPGDILVGDETGIVVIERDAAEDVLAAAEDIAEMERSVREHIDDGGALEDAL